VFLQQQVSVRAWVLFILAVNYLEFLILSIPLNLFNS
jgi:hypothetical protein